MIAAVIGLATEMFAAVTVAASDGDAPGWLLVLGPAGGGALYVGLWGYYRNTSRSHSYERETRITSQPATGDDTKVRTITGTKKSGIDGNNRTNHRQRVQRS